MQNDKVLERFSAFVELDMACSEFGTNENIPGAWAVTGGIWESKDMAISCGPVPRRATILEFGPEDFIESVLVVKYDDDEDDE